MKKKLYRFFIYYPFQKLKKKIDQVMINCSFVLYMINDFH